MAESEQGFYERGVRRISTFILVLGLAGATLLAVVKGIPIGFAFLVGAAVSYLSFWRWQKVVNALAPVPKKRPQWFFIAGVVALVTLAWVIIKFLGLNVGAAVSGMLVSGAAVILELVYELIYGRT